MLGRMGVDSLAGGCPDGLNCKETRLTINTPDKIMRRIENSSEYPFSSSSSCSFSVNVTMTSSYLDELLRRLALPCKRNRIASEQSHRSSESTPKARAERAFHLGSGCFGARLASKEADSQFLCILF